MAIHSSLKRPRGAVPGSAADSCENPPVTVRLARSTLLAYTY
jgi:hypothetical protein